MKLLQDRFKAILDALQLTPNAFALTHGLNVPAIYRLVNGTRTPSSDTLVELCQLEPRLSADFLLRGEGPPLLDQQTQPLPAAPNTELPLDLIHSWQHLQKSINRTIDQELLRLNDPSNQRLSGSSQPAAPLPEPVSDGECVLSPTDGLEMSMLKRMINTFAQLQRTYSLAFEAQADPKRYKLETEWVPNPASYMLNRVVAAHLALSGSCSPERFLTAHGLYCRELIYCRGSQFMPSGDEFESWQFLLRTDLFMADRLNLAHKSVNYFLTKSGDHTVARHYVSLATQLTS